VTNGTTGTNLGDEPAVAGSPDALLEGLLDRAADRINQASCALEYSNKQEAQKACQLLEEARDLLTDAWHVREGQRRSKAEHGAPAEAGSEGPQA